MKHPKLTVALAERGERAVLLFSRNDSTLCNRLESGPLSRIRPFGRSRGSRRIGTDDAACSPSAGIRAISGPSASKWSNCKPKGVRYLIHGSILDRTRAYVPAIDAMFQRHADELSGTALYEGWPKMRDRFLRDYPD